MKINTVYRKTTRAATRAPRSSNRAQPPAHALEDLTRRLLDEQLAGVDEAWQLMRYEDSANFLFSLAKRARKYNLGITTITQDVEDFMSSRMGRAKDTVRAVSVLAFQAITTVSPSVAGVIGGTIRIGRPLSKSMST